MTIDFNTLSQRLMHMPLLESRSIELLQLLNQDNILDQLDVLEQKITLDAALAGNLMRLANSPFFGHAQAIKNIRHACVSLGIDALKALIGTMLLNRDMMRLPPSRSLSYPRLWQHALLSAFITRELVLLNGQFKAQMSFMSALFHDIHLVVLDVFYPETMVRALYAARQSERPLEVIFMAHELPNPSLINDHILTFWRFPDSTNMPYRAALDGQSEPLLLQIIRLARLLAAGLSHRPVDSVVLHPPVGQHSTALGIDLSWVLEASARGHRQFLDFQNMLSQEA